jgi:mono/diheme cytochrome c family protein
MKQKYGIVTAAAVALLILWLLVAPPRWWLNLTKAVDLSDPVAAGEQVTAQYDCRSCHRIAGQGALIAPALDDAAVRLDDVSLRLWLRNPRAIKGNTAMPNFRMSDSEIEAVVAYLQSLATE